MVAAVRNGVHRIAVPIRSRAWLGLLVVATLLAGAAMFLLLWGRGADSASDSDTASTRNVTLESPDEGLLASAFAPLESLRTRSEGTVGPVAASATTTAPAATPDRSGVAPTASTDGAPTRGGTAPVGGGTDNTSTGGGATGGGGGTTTAPTTSTTTTTTNTTTTPPPTSGGATVTPPQPVTGGATVTAGAGGTNTQVNVGDANVSVGVNPAGGTVDAGVNLGNQPVVSVGLNANPPAAGTPPPPVVSVGGASGGVQVNVGGINVGLLGG